MEMLFLLLVFMRSAMALKPLFTGDYPKVDLYKKLEILKAMPLREDINL